MAKLDKRPHEQAAQAMSHLAHTQENRALRGANQGRVARGAGNIARRFSGLAKRGEEYVVKGVAHGDHAQIKGVKAEISASQAARRYELKVAQPYVLDLTTPAIAYAKGKDGTDRALSKMLLFGESVIGVVVTSRGEGDDKVEESVDFLRLPMDRDKYRDKLGQNTTPLDNLAHIDLLGLEGRMVDGKMKEFEEFRIGRENLGDEYASDGHISGSVDAKRKLTLYNNSMTNPTFLVDGYSFEGIEGISLDQNNRKQATKLQDFVQRDVHTWEPSPQASLISRA